MGIAESHLLAGWIGMLCGVISGAAMGLFFHNADWLGGYASLRRRLVRLGHISFFGLGFLNVMFGLSVNAMPIPALNLQLASLGLFVGAASMPVCCFLTAWRAQLKPLFAIPVIGVAAGIVGTLAGWLT